jgi:hypothetical protein
MSGDGRRMHAMQRIVEAGYAIAIATGPDGRVMAKAFHGDSLTGHGATLREAVQNLCDLWWELHPRKPRHTTGPEPFNVALGEVIDTIIEQNKPEDTP